MYEEFENEDYPYYASPSYLGRSGITFPCKQAMAAILTSAFRPRKITMVIGKWEHPQPVLFLVWDWLVQEVTIIPDGFGTHGGEGGRGLSDALALIKFYGIPLEQVSMYEKDAFRELAQGHLTEKIFTTIQDAREYNWNFYPVSEVRKVKRGRQQFLEVKEADGNIDFTIPLP